MKKQNRNILAITDKLLGLHLTLNVAENNRFYSTSFPSFPSDNNSGLLFLPSPRDSEDFEARLEQFCLSLDRRYIYKFKFYLSYSNDPILIDYNKFIVYKTLFFSTIKVYYFIILI